MTRLLLQDILLRDPQSPYNGQQVDLRLEGTQIKAVAPTGSLNPEAGEDTFHYPGAAVSPGWVDMQVHLSDPGYEHKESLAQLALAGSRGGFTALLTYPNTQPVIDRAPAVAALQRRSAGLPLRMLICGSLTEGAQGKDLTEVYDMQREGAVAFTDGDHPIQAAGVLLRGLQYLRAFDGLLIQMPQETSIARQGQMNEGPASARLGMPGIPELAELLAVQRDLGILAYTGGRLHLQPLTAPEAVAAVQAQRDRLPGLSTGIPAYYFAFTDADLEAYDTHLKVFPPLRSAAQQAALRQALRQGAFDVLSSGHQAQGLEEKALEFTLADPGMLSLQTFFPVVNTHLIGTQALDWDAFVRMVAIRPREILRQAPAPVAAGATADLSLFHPGESWQLQAADLPSRAKNSPWLGQSLTGRVLGTYVEGRFHRATAPQRAGQ